MSAVRLLAYARKLVPLDRGVVVVLAVLLAFCGVVIPFLIAHPIALLPDRRTDTNVAVIDDESDDYGPLAGC